MSDVSDRDFELGRYVALWRIEGYSAVRVSAAECNEGHGLFLGLEQNVIKIFQRYNNSGQRFIQNDSLECREHV
jgi:hypothetical protein